MMNTDAPAFVPAVVQQQQGTSNSEYIRRGPPKGVPSVNLTEEEEQALRAKHTAYGMAIQDTLNHKHRILSVPAFHTVSTRGKQEYYNPRMVPRVFSLCNHYQMGSCSFVGSCLDIHVDRSFVEAMRSVMNDPPCCAYHNNYYTRELLADSTWMKAQRYVIRHDGRKFLIPVERTAWTLGLESLSKDPVSGHRYVGVESLCAGFREGACKLGKQCPNLHICPETIATALGLEAREPVKVASDMSKFKTKLSPPLPLPPMPILQAAPHVAAQQVIAPQPFQPPMIGQQQPMMMQQPMYIQGGQQTMMQGGQPMMMQQPMFPQQAIYQTQPMFSPQQVQMMPQQQFFLQ